MTIVYIRSTPLRRLTLVLTAPLVLLAVIPISMVGGLIAGLRAWWGACEDAWRGQRFRR